MNNYVDFSFTPTSVKSLLEKAIDGNAEAIYELGLLSNKEDGLNALSDSHGLEYFEVAAAKGHEASKLEIAKAYIAGDTPYADRDLIYRYLVEAMEADVPDSAFYLARFHMDKGTPYFDEEKAIELLLKNPGEKGSRVYLYRIYADPTSHYFDPLKAFGYLELGASEHEEACESLMLIFNRGFGRSYYSYMRITSLASKEQAEAYALALEVGFRVPKSVKAALRIHEVLANWDDMPIISIRDLWEISSGRREVPKPIREKEKDATNK